MKPVIFRFKCSFCGTEEVPALIDEDDPDAEINTTRDIITMHHELYLADTQVDNFTYADEDRDNKRELPLKKDSEDGNDPPP